MVRKKFNVGLNSLDDPENAMSSELLQWGAASTTSRLSQARLAHAAFPFICPGLIH